MFEWLILVYKVPAEPSRYRAAIWRKVKASGAVYLQNSICILPSNSETERQFRYLRKQIIEFGGEGYIFKGTTLGDELDARLVELFKQAREEEYAEIIDRCDDFFREIDEETENSHFTYAELEENEEDLVKLEQWFNKVKQRDFFGAGLAGKTAALLTECRKRLDRFAEQVFQSEDSNHPGNFSRPGGKE
ncbi:MAG: hypothetical protein K6U04_14860 [Armatimonadetes bacterium]|nr:hypothetical protein [Armatimonadota bacterium]